MRIAITGGTGFVGGYLVPMLRQGGHEVVALARDEKRARTKLPEDTEVFEYNPYDAESVAEGLEGADAVINLAGAGLFSKRWSKAHMRMIRDSRVVGTRTLVEALGTLEKKPSVLISGSAIGFYGPRPGDEICEEDELDPCQFRPRDFLAGVCKEWESAARKAELLGMRVVRLRTGIVLGKGEGALGAMETPFKLGGGGPVASGKQVMSWIHVEDLCRMIIWALEAPAVAGALNGTAPNPVTNKEFAKALGRALGRPAFIPTPGPMLRMILGKVAQVIVNGQRVPPLKAQALGFTFHYPTIDDALRAIYSKQAEPALSA
jgi:uncharacterized protein (TIGR01777 family)